MGMHIQFNTDELSDIDKGALRVIVGGEAATLAGQAAALAERVAVTKTPAPAKKSPAPKPEPTPEPEVEPETEGATVDDAVALASKLLSAGKQPQIKAVLSDLGVKRVSEMTDEQAPEFIAALSGLLDD